MCPFILSVASIKSSAVCDKKKRREIFSVIPVISNSIKEIGNRKFCMTISLPTALHFLKRRRRVSLNYLTIILWLLAASSGAAKKKTTAEGDIVQGDSLSKDARLEVLSGVLSQIERSYGKGTFAHWISVQTISSSWMIYKRMQKKCVSFMYYSCNWRIFVFCRRSFNFNHKNQI